jgi:hypothetical protein
VLVRCQTSLTCLAKPLTIFRNILSLLTTDPIRKIFDEFHIRLLARLMVNNRKDPLTAYTLTLYGSQERQELERANSTHGADEPVVNSLIDLKSFMKGDFDFESAIDHACEVTGNSGALLCQKNCYHLTQRR